MTVREVETAITQLTAKDLAQWMAWFDNYRAKMWDKQIEEDLEAGRLDAALAEVDAEYKRRIRLDPPEGSTAKVCEPA